MEKENQQAIYSKVIRAGKRTYFFDVKSTRGNDLYLTITESKKTNEDGRENFEKHKLFLYKEDFDKFQEGIEDVLSKIKEMKAAYESPTLEPVSSKIESFSFEEL